MCFDGSSLSPPLLHRTSSLSSNDPVSSTSSVTRARTFLEHETRLAPHDVVPIVGRGRGVA